MVSQKPYTMNIKYKPFSCIVSALMCCVLASLTSANNNISEQLSALNIEERPCCKNNVVTEYWDCPKGQDKHVLNCRHLYKMEIGIEHIVVLDGVIQDHDFNHEAEYCTGVTDDGIAIITRCHNQDASRSKERLFFSKGIMMLVSAVFTAATGYVYFIIPGRHETQHKATLSVVTYLTVIMLIIGMERITFLEYILCANVLEAFALYFCMISYFAWTNIAMASIWKSTVYIFEMTTPCENARRWNIKESVWSIVMNYYAITVAVICTGWVFLHHQKRKFVTLSWWYNKHNSDAYIAYIPMGVMLCISTTLLVWIIFHQQGDENSPFRYKCILYVKLYLLSGLTWTFEILSFYVFQDSYNRSWFWLPFDAINCLHGILLFLVLVVCRPNIKRELFGKRIFCCHFPADWGQPQGDEQSQLAEGVEANEAESGLQMSPTLDA